MLQSAEIRQGKELSTLIIYYSKLINFEKEQNTLSRQKRIGKLQKKKHDVKREKWLCCLS